MTTSSTDDTPLTPAPARPKPGHRAKTACKHCNARRVKCDVMQQQPCWHCRTRNVPCELINSRRGKYIRQPTAKARAQVRGKTHAKARAASVHGHPPSTASPVTSEASSRRRHTSDHVHRTTLPGATSTGALETGTVEVEDDDEDEDDASTGRRSQPDGPEMLFARMADTDAVTVRPPTTVPDQDRTFYLGEAFNLAFVVTTVCSPAGDTSGRKLHYPIPASVSDRARPASSPSPRSGEGGRRHSAPWPLPDPPVLDELLHLFFHAIHPAFPVLDLAACADEYRHQRMSPLVLHAILFLATTICDERLLRRAGFTDRSEARRTFYLRAKALYDADNERDKIKLTAALVLLGFWWQGPEDQKDSWYWVGAALSQAQTLGLHRSTAMSELSPRRRSLWKRIWWSIYVRDRHVAAALGRPTRIRDQDCDVEMLTEHDFAYQDNPCPHVFGGALRHHVLYVMEMAKLAVLLGRIMSTEYAPRPCRDGATTRALAHDLHHWERQLPPEMARRPLEASLGAPFWAGMLYIHYQNCQILFYRPRCVEIGTVDDAERDMMARGAADATTRIAEDLLSAGTVQYSPVHLIPALFAALSIHSIVIRRRDTVRSQLAENRARQCMLALSELAKSWPVGGWILRLFVHLLGKLTGRNRPPGIDTIPPLTRVTDPARRLDTLLPFPRGGDTTPHAVTPGRGAETAGSTGSSTDTTLGAPGTPLDRIEGWGRPGEDDGDGDALLRTPGAALDDLWSHDFDLPSFDYIFRESLDGFGGYHVAVDAACAKGDDVE